MAYIIIFILFNIVLIVAQVLITSKDSGKRGLIIPLFNIIMALAVALFTSPYSFTLVREIGGTEVAETTVNTGGFIGSFTMTLLLMLIPAIINFILYFIGRNKFKEQKMNDINRMKIDDLT